MFIYLKNISLKNIYNDNIYLLVFVGEIMIFGNFLINFFDVGGIFFFLLNVLINSF